MARMGDLPHSTQSVPISTFCIFGLHPGTVWLHMHKNPHFPYLLDRRLTASKLVHKSSNLNFSEPLAEQLEETWKSWWQQEYGYG